MCFDGVTPSLSCRSRWRTKVAALLVVDERQSLWDRHLCKGR
jgi:hypothetical protein